MMTTMVVMIDYVVTNKKDYNVCDCLIRIALAERINRVFESQSLF